MTNKKRLEKLEAKMLDRDYGLRVVTPISYLYGESEPYWTDEPIKGIEAFYTDEPYRRVEHPDGEEAGYGKRQE